MAQEHALPDCGARTGFALVLALRLRGAHSPELRALVLDMALSKSLVVKSEGKKDGNLELLLIANLCRLTELASPVLRPGNGTGLDLGTGLGFLRMDAQFWTLIWRSCIAI